MPLANAGGTVEVEYLTADEESCAESRDSTWNGWSEEYYDNATATYHRWGYSEGSYYSREGCESSYRTLELAASEEDGAETGRVTVGGDDASGRSYDGDSQYSYYYRSSPDGQSGWYHGSGQATSTSNDTWWAGARAQASGSEAMLGRGCDRAATSEDRWAHYHSSSRDAEGNQTSSSWGHAWDGRGERADRCYTGVESGSTFVGQESACNGRTDSSGWMSESEYGNETSRYGYGYSRSESSCRDGVAARAASEEAFVGYRSECSAWSYSSTYPTENGTKSSDHSSEGCEEGFVTVELPEGLALFVGQQWWSGSGTCYENGESGDCREYHAQLGARASWTQSPLGPTEHSFFVPLA